MADRNSRTNEPSLAVASLPRKGVAIAFGTKLIFARYFNDDEDTTASPFNSVHIDDGQIIRAVAFLKVPDGPICLVTAGDSKMINFYNLSSLKQNNSEAPGDSSDEEGDTMSEERKKRLATLASSLKPCFSFGPHQKRITHLAATDDGTLIFADKFGEVHRFSVLFSPDHKIEFSGDKKEPLQFLVQHFSVMTSVFLSAPVPRIEPISTNEALAQQHPRRLFTCDKDLHCRVSRYPETYAVEQFLWQKGTKQSAVTCVTEIPYPEEPGVPGARRTKMPMTPFSYYVTGSYDGRVTFWAARNNLPHAESAPDIFNVVGVYDPVEQGDNGWGAVVGLTYIASDRDHTGNIRNPRDQPRGVLVAYENNNDVVYIPVLDGMGKFDLRVNKVACQKFLLEHGPVFLVASSTNTSMTMMRDGSVAYIRLQDAPVNTEDVGKICSFNGTIPVELKRLSLTRPYLVERIRSVMCQPIAGGDGNTLLSELDLFAQWKFDVNDPRERQHDREDSEGDGDAEEKAPENGSQPGKKGAATSPSKKKARKEKA